MEFFCILLVEILIKILKDCNKFTVYNAMIQ